MGNGTRIGKVRGLGSARQGTHHWLLQRYTAAGNLALVVWFVISLVMLPNFQFSTVHGWLSQPLAASAMVLLVISTFWHARLGLQVVVEDYVDDHASRFGLVVLLNLLFVAGAVFAIVSLIRIALGGA